MFKKQKTGSVLCHACNKLVSVDAETCIHCGAKNPGLWGYGRSIRKLSYDLGFTTAVTFGCVGLYLISLLIDPGGVSMNSAFRLLAPSSESLYTLGSTGSIPVFVLGRWWTLLTAGWLHGSLFHIAFNLIWIRQMSILVAKCYGAARLYLIYTFSIISGAFITSFVSLYFPTLPPVLQGAPLSIGASGGLFGLLGALVSYGQQTGEDRLKQQIWIFAIVGLLFGFFMGNVDNWGHIGGFVGGYVLTYLPWFAPRNRQKLWEVFGAIACLILAAVGIVVSVLDAYLSPSPFL